MQNKIVIFVIAFASLAIAKEISKASKVLQVDYTTITPQHESSSVKNENSTIAGEETITDSSSTSSASIEDGVEANDSSALSQTTQRKKILYINQQQSGKFNVHLELNDVSLIVIPNRKDPQLSLLNLLLRSAQKSSSLKKNEAYEKNKVTTEINQSIHQNDEPYHPVIESRIAPYKIDISSTLGTDIGSRSSIIKGFKTLPIDDNHSRIFKRSIDLNFYGANFDSPVLDDKNISNDVEEEQLTESITNSLENNDKLYGNMENGSEFILLGAEENCGPDRHRNSYQVCENNYE